MCSLRSASLRTPYRSSSSGACLVNSCRNCDSVTCELIPNLSSILSQPGSWNDPRMMSRIPESRPPHDFRRIISTAHPRGSRFSIRSCSRFYLWVKMHQLFTSPIPSHVPELVSAEAPAYCPMKWPRHLAGAARGPVDVPLPPCRYPCRPIPEHRSSCSICRTGPTALELREGC